MALVQIGADSRDSQGLCKGQAAHHGSPHVLTDQISARGMLLEAIPHTTTTMHVCFGLAQTCFVLPTLLDPTRRDSVLPEAVAAHGVVSSVLENGTAHTLAIMVPGVQVAASIGQVQEPLVVNLSHSKADIVGPICLSWL